MPTFEDAITFLDNNPGQHTYGDVAEALGIPREDGGQAVGSMMRAIHRRGLHHYCERVVDSETGMHNCDDIDRLIDDFIGRLAEPYENENPLLPERYEDVNGRYLIPLEQSIHSGDLDVVVCLHIMQGNIDRYVEKKGTDECLRRWKRCCRGIADYLLRPRLHPINARRVAAGVVVRLSRYVNTMISAYTEFRPAAKMLSQEFWKTDIPNLMAADIRIGGAGLDPQPIWKYLAEPSTNEEKRYAASRFINFLAAKELCNAEVNKDDFDWIVTRLDAFDVNEPNVDEVAKRVRMRAEAVEDALQAGFDVSETYSPGSQGRRCWLKRLHVISPPLTFEKAFIRLREAEGKAKQALQDIAKRIGNTALENSIAQNWQVDHMGYIQSQLACRLFCFAVKHADTRTWFDESLKSDSCDVSYSAFETRVGREQAAQWREKKDVDIEDEVKGELTRKA